MFWAGTLRFCLLACTASGVFGVALLRLGGGVPVVAGFRGLGRWLLRIDGSLMTPRQLIALGLLLLLLLGTLAALVAVARVSLHETRRRLLLLLVFAATNAFLLLLLRLIFNGMGWGWWLATLGNSGQAAAAAALLRYTAPSRNRLHHLLREEFARLATRAERSNGSFVLVSGYSDRSLLPGEIAALRRELRYRDVIAPCRGGYVALLSHTDLETSYTQVVPKLVATHTQLGVGARLHLVSYPRHGRDLSTLLTAAAALPTWERAPTEVVVSVPNYPLPEDTHGFLSQLTQRYQAGEWVMLRLRTTLPPRPAEVWMLRARLRPEDLLVPIQDGFFVLLPNTDASGGLAVAKQLKQSLDAVEGNVTEVWLVEVPRQVPDVGSVLRELEHPDRGERLSL